MNTDWLQAQLTTLADQYGEAPVDLAAGAVGRSRRRAVRQAVLAAAAVLVVAGGTVMALRPGPSAAPPLPGATTTGHPTPTPTLFGELATVDVPPGALDLADATLDLPSLPWDISTCVGRVRFHAFHGQEHVREGLRIAAEWTGDVNRDGVDDTLAMVICDWAELPLWQVVAFERAPGGSIRTIGQVVSIGPGQQPSSLFSLRIAPDGHVVAQVGDHLGSLGLDAVRISTHQERVYRWDGSRFVQVAGPTVFPPNPHVYRLNIGVASLALGPPGDGRRDGNLTLTVTNVGPGTARNVVVSADYPDVVRPDGGPAWANCSRHGVEQGVIRVSCPLGTLAAGETRTVTLGVTTAATTHLSNVADQVTANVVGQDDLGYTLEQPMPGPLRVDVTFG